MYKQINDMYMLRERFVIIGVTGRTGSGCTTAAKFLSNDKCYLESSSFSDLPQKDQQELNIIKSFLGKHWNKFYHIQFRDIISTFILESKYAEAKEYLKGKFSIDFDDFEEIYNEFYEKNKIIDDLAKGNIEGFYTANKCIDESKVEKLIKYIFSELPQFTNKLRDFLNRNKSQYTYIFQNVGDNIRKTGCAFKSDTDLFENIYSICRRINSFIKIIRRYNHYKAHDAKSYFVLDAFRNPLEVLFFRERFAAFYLISINCKEKNRRERLFNSQLDIAEIENIDRKEAGGGNFFDTYESYIGQDIKQCVLMSDIFIDNTEDKQGLGIPRMLSYNLSRIIALIQHPGLVKPSRYEFLMQIAYTASTNSGCLSRNVGAIVTDSKAEPLGIGWNCVPKGHTPCYLRSADKLDVENTSKVYSQYERTNGEFKAILHKMQEEIFLSEAFQQSGLPQLYCFKKIKNTLDGDKNQVHTRALHAEENAFLQIAKHSNRSMEGGILFTSSSPCVLCAKKAYQLGIKEIVYIDPYPDISQEHILSSGTAPLPMIFYTGVIGSAFFKLYIPFISIKDEIYAYRQ